jgi:hypothetical protein
MGENMQEEKLKPSKTSMLVAFASWFAGIICSVTSLLAVMHAVHANHPQRTHCDKRASGQQQLPRERATVNNLNSGKPSNQNEHHQ